MAAKITHLEVLRQSLYLMEHGSKEQKEISDLLRASPLLHRASLGAIAPDLFYFFNVLSRKKNKLGQKWGNLIHHKNVLELVLAMLDRTGEKTGDVKDRLLAFILGYVSHCAVDIVTHPYIFYITGDYYSLDLEKASKAQVNHLRVEFALDSYLVHQRWGMSPHEYNFIQYVDSQELKSKRKIYAGFDMDIRSMWMSALMECFPDEFSTYNLKHPEKDDPICESYSDFLSFNKIIDTSSFSMRMLLKGIDVFTFHRLKTRYLLLPPHQHIPKRFPNTDNEIWKYPAMPNKESSESFMDLIHRSARFSSDFMTDTVKYLNGNMKKNEMIKKYGGYNLDTGIRSESSSMTEFDPIEEE